MNAPAIQLTHLNKAYGSLTAVDDLNLEVPPGQILALLGPNGAGKSTTTEMVLGITEPDAGTVRVFGLPPTAAIRGGETGAMLQNGTLLWDTGVGRLLKAMHSIHRHPIPLAEVIRRADVGDILRTSTSKLSGGQAQRVRFALAIMGDPRLLVLDEPTVGLDVEARRRFWSSMDELVSTGRTVVFATHYLDEADEFADRIVVLDKGAIVADGPGTQIKQVVGNKLVSFVGPAYDWLSVAGVLSAEPLGERTQLTCTDADAALRSILCELQLSVNDIQVTSPSLEDAFLTITKGAQS